MKTIKQQQQEYKLRALFCKQAKDMEITKLLDSIAKAEDWFMKNDETNPIYKKAEIKHQELVREAKTRMNLKKDEEYIEVVKEAMGI